MNRSISEDEIIVKLRQFPDFRMETERQSSVLAGMRQSHAKNERTRLRQKWLKMATLSGVLVVLFVAGYVIGNPSTQKDANNTISTIPTTWEPSPIFTKSIKMPDGSSREESFRGVEGKIAIPVYWDFVANDTRLNSKVLISVFDRELLISEKGDHLSGFLKAKAVHMDTGETIDLTRPDGIVTVVSAPKDDEEYSYAHSIFEPFPYSGLWRMDIFINEDYYESIVLHVKEPYIKLDSSEILISTEDVIVGTHEQVQLEVDGSGLPESVTVKATNEEKGMTQEFPFKKEGEFWRSTNKEQFTAYVGSLLFDQPGKWKIEILGEETVVNVIDKKSL